MALIKLDSRERQSLERIARSSSSAREVRRAQALIWLHRGEGVEQVARRLSMSRQAIYVLVTRYSSRKVRPILERIQDQPHTGRPAGKLKKVAKVIQRLLSRSPSRYGYRSPFWTVPMLKGQVGRQLAEPVSDDTIRRALSVLRYRYKRPRYVLARRSRTWRQAKGGSSAISNGENERPF